MDLTQIAVLSGFVATSVIVLVTIGYQKHFEPKDFYSFIIGFISGCNLPPSVFLCLYVFYPDAPHIQTKLKGHERYIALAGVVLLIASLMTLWKLFKDAKKRDQPLH